MTGEVTETEFDTVKNSFLEELHDQLTERFSDVQEGLLKSTKILDLPSWPAELSDGIIIFTLTSLILEFQKC